MSDETRQASATLRQCRIVAAQLVGGCWPGRDADWVETRIAALAPLRQVGVIAGVLGLLFLLSLFAAQFGLVGLALFLLAVVVIVA